MVANSAKPDCNSLGFSKSSWDISTMKRKVQAKFISWGQGVEKTPSFRVVSRTASPGERLTMSAAG